MTLDGYRFLRLDLEPDGVLVVSFDRPDRLNAVPETGHAELVRIWPEADRHPEVGAVLLRAEGRAFSAGGDFEMIERIMTDRDTHRRVLGEARDLVRNMVEMSKPVVSAINGPAVGAGLAAALLADIPIAARSARILDGHTTLGVAAGDHAVLIWPLLVGMAKAEYHLLTNQPIDGTEAERLGLVALVVEDDELEATARRVAADLAGGARQAIRWTKHTLNHWLRAAYPAFDAPTSSSGSWGPRRKMSALWEKRPPELG